MPFKNSAKKVCDLYTCILLFSFHFLFNFLPTVLLQNNNLYSRYIARQRVRQSHLALLDVKSSNDVNKGTVLDTVEQISLMPGHT